MRKATIFGGSFDPIHYGHLIISQDILIEKKLEKILFLPSVSPPHKKSYAPFTDRVNMVNLAIEGNPKFQCSDFEKTLPKPSYTINSLRSVKKEFGFSKISFIIGMDSAVEFDTWKDPDVLLKEFEIIVILRTGYAKEDVSERFRKKMIFFNTRCIDISSTEIRKRIKKGKIVKYLTPDSVFNYIRKKDLYT